MDMQKSAIPYELIGVTAPRMRTNRALVSLEPPNLRSLQIFGLSRATSHKFSERYAQWFGDIETLEISYSHAFLYEHALQVASIHHGLRTIITHYEHDKLLERMLEPSGGSFDGELPDSLRRLQITHIPTFLVQYQ